MYATYQRPIEWDRRCAFRTCVLVVRVRDNRIDKIRSFYDFILFQRFPPLGSVVRSFIHFLHFHFFFFHFNEKSNKFNDSTCIVCVWMWQSLWSDKYPWFPFGMAQKTKGEHNKNVNYQKNRSRSIADGVAHANAQAHCSQRYWTK